MYKMIFVFACSWLAFSVVSAQLPDTLQVIHLEKGQPVSFTLHCYEKGGYQYIKTIDKYGVREERINEKEIKDGLHRLFSFNGDRTVNVHFLKNSNLGYWYYAGMHGLSSLTSARGYLPDLSLFSHALTNRWMKPYFGRPALDTLSKKEIISFIDFQLQTMISLRQLCEYMAKHAGATYDNRSAGELYTLLREKYIENAYLNWLDSRGYNGGSYMALVFELLRWSGNKDVMDKSEAYERVENALH